MSSPNSDSIEEQLRQRRARLAAQSNRSLPAMPNQLDTNSNTQSNTQSAMTVSNPTALTHVHVPSSPPNPSHDSDFELAMRLQREFDAQDAQIADQSQSQSQSQSHSIDLTGDETDSLDIAMLDRVSQPQTQNTQSMQRQSVIDRDHEIALQLQRQLDQQEERSQPRMQPQPQMAFHSNHNRPAQGNGGAYSFSRSSNPNGGVVTFTTISNDGTRRTQTFNSGANGNDMGGMGGMDMFGSGSGFPFGGSNPFADPFFQRGGRGGDGGSGSGSFDAPMFGRNMGGMGMPPMVNMNMMINNLMMGGMGAGMGGMGGMDGMFMPHVPPPVANQRVIDANTQQDTFHQEEGKQADADEDEAEGDGKGKGKEKKKEQCSICLEEFKNGDSIRRLPCFHIFHTHEIDRWLKTGNDKCPICRVPIDGSALPNQAQ